VIDQWFTTVNSACSQRQFVHIEIKWCIPHDNSLVMCSWYRAQVSPVPSPHLYVRD